MSAYTCRELRQSTASKDINFYVDKEESKLLCDMCGHDRVFNLLMKPRRDGRHRISLSVDHVYSICNESIKLTETESNQIGKDIFKKYGLLYHVIYEIKKRFFIDFGEDYENRFRFVPVVVSQDNKYFLVINDY
jgi:hypothetical protein